MSDEGVCDQSPAGQDSHLFVVDENGVDCVKNTKNLMLTVKVHCMWCGKKVKCRGWIHE